MIDDYDSPLGLDVRATLLGMQKLDDANLALLLRQPSPAMPLDLCLTEILRRGGADWQKTLDARVAEIVRQRLPKKATATSQTAASQEEWKVSNLRELTTLRRLQKLNDPMILLLPGKPKRACPLGYSPLLEINATNIDSKGTPIYFATGGDYRGSSRPGKWRMSAKCEDGKPVKMVRDISMGGFLTEQELQFGESYQETLGAYGYVELDRPGVYTLLLEFSEQYEIGNHEVAEGVITSRSQPIQLKIEPWKIKMNETRREQIRQWIADLPISGVVKIHGGVYGKASHGFISPDSPAGELLSAGWGAVPDLIAAALEPKTNATQRAWILGLLYSITGLNCPFAHGLFGSFDIETKGMLGTYDYRQMGEQEVVILDGAKYVRPVRLGSLTHGRGTSAATNPYGSSAVTIPDPTTKPTDDPDAEKQLEFTEKHWRPWIQDKYVSVVNE